MNRRFTFRGLLGLVLIVISSFLGYNWLTGGSAESADTSPCSQADIELGGKVLFCNVRLYDADSAIYTNAMEKCNTEDAICYGFTNTAQQTIDIELTVTRLDGDTVWLSDGEGDALQCDVNSIDTRNIRFLVCSEDIRTDMVKRQVSGLNATLTDAEVVEADKQSSYCYNSASLACWASTGIRENVIGFVLGLFQ
jgi:hypothetical protein